MVYDALWELALRAPIIGTTVKVGNRISYGTDSPIDPHKNNASDADLPELTLVTEGISEGNIGRTSCTTSLLRQYSFVISTGDFRANHLLYPIEFALFCAMTGWTTTLTALEWEGQRFVKRCQLVNASEGLSDPQRNRGIKGWAAIWAVSVEMHFTTSSLKAVLED
jgi:hypothetical protein